MSCPDCTKGIILPGEPRGAINVDGSYLAKGPENSQSSSAIILLTDIFGLPLKNSKILADNLSQRLSCDVWVPDLFDGKPPFKPDQLKLPDRAGVKRSFWDKILFFFSILSGLPRFIRSRPSVVDARITSFITKLQAEKKYERLGAVGYCFGGTVAIRLGSTNLVHSIVVCHPGKFSNQQLEALKVPSSWACAEDDFSFPADIRREAEARLAARKGKDNAVEYEFKDYQGTAHGFAARPNLSIPEVKKGYEEAFEQTVEWFRKTVFD